MGDDDHERMSGRHLGDLRQDFSDAASTQCQSSNNTTRGTARELSVNSAAIASIRLWRRFVPLQMRGNREVPMSDRQQM